MGGQITASLDPSALSLDFNLNVVPTGLGTPTSDLTAVLDFDSTGFASAYAGNLTLGRKILPRPKVSHIISGHAHLARTCIVPRDGLPPVEVRVLPGDYEKPAWLGLTLNA